MQRDLDALDLPVPVVILGLCEVGQGSETPLMTDGRDLPWLQDVPEVNAWGTWGAAQRDLVIVDTDNVEVDRIGLTDFDLYETANYEALVDQLVELTER